MPPQLSGVAPPSRNGTIGTTEIAKSWDDHGILHFFAGKSSFYSVDLGIRYFACALVGFGVIWMSRRWLAGKRPIPKLPNFRQIRREIFYSVLTIVICGCIQS